MKFLILSSLILALAGGVACGDDDSDGDNNDPGNNDPGNNDPNNDPGGDFSTGLPDDKKLSELDEGDNTTACEAVEAGTRDLEDDLKAFSCAISGLFTAAFTDGSVATCEAAESECLQEPFEGEDSECVFEPTDCEATVGEMEACLNEQLDAIKAFNVSFDCASALAEAEANPEANPLEPGPRCQAVQAKCPDLFEDEEG